MLHTLVIVGGGPGGIKLAKTMECKFGSTEVQIILIDKKNHHLFQPLLYQVATASLSSANIATPLRTIFRRNKSVKVLLAQVEDINPAEKIILLAHGEKIHFDTLVLAAGATNNYFNHPEWEPFALGLKSIEDATRIRGRILAAFEKAERSNDLEKQKKLLTFVVIGAGPTGVEMAGSIAELSHKTLRGEFRNIQPELARIILIEAANRPLIGFKEAISASATRALQNLKVELHLNSFVENITSDEVVYKYQNQFVVIPTQTVIWAAGVKANPLTNCLAKTTGVALDRLGRIMVMPNFQIPNHSAIFALGDIVHYPSAEGGTLPGVASVATQQAKFLAKLIKARLTNSPEPTFIYVNKGSMAIIGRSSAVADLGWIRLSGFFAWIAWLLIHLLFTIQFQNKILIALQWAWNYLTFNRSARIILEKEHIP